MMRVRNSQRNWLFIYDGWMLIAKGFMAIGILVIPWTLGLVVWALLTIRGNAFGVLIVIAALCIFAVATFFGGRLFLNLTKRLKMNFIAEENVARYERMIDEANSQEEPQLYQRLLIEAKAVRT